MQSSAYYVNVLIHTLWKIQFRKKLFGIGFPYKHCNFWPLCLPVKMASKTVIRPFVFCWIVPLFSVFTNHVIKIKIVTIQWKKSRVWDTIDDCYINNLAKNQVSAVFYSRIICRSVSPKVIELCMETPCLCPSEGHKHGGRKVTEISVTEFCYWNTKLLL